MALLLQGGPVCVPRTGRQIPFRSQQEIQARFQSRDAIDEQEQMHARDGQFFLPAACLAATACFFFWSALLAMACFCVDFFWFDFGDLSPIIVIVFCALTPLRHVSFAEGKP